VSLGLGCGFICLIKPGSEAYALMILGIAFIDVLFFRRKDFADLFRNGARWIAVPFSVVFTAASYVSWKLFTASNNMLQVFDYVTVTDEQSASAETIAAHFWQAVTTARTGRVIPLSYIWWIAILAGLGLLAVVFAKGARASVRAVIYTLLTIVGYVGYGAVLLFMYIYLFTPVEGASLASLDRYMCTYLLGAVIFLVYMIADNIMERFESVGKLLLLIPIMLVLAVAPLGKALDSYINFQTEIDKTVEKRQIYSEVASLPEKLDYTKDRVYFIAQDTNGYEYQVSYYLATPVPLSYDFEMGWSLGTPYSEQDVWTLNFTPAQWHDKLIEGGYTYVYLFRPDLKFKSTYRSLFENPDDIADNTCFSVTVENGRVLLKKAF
ncbi:MAG: hypothetical protein HUJ75_02395, partial [Parasporobacterium sp.]|nr:hypothetical protein [Parasporobacterium sp.]